MVEQQHHIQKLTFELASTNRGVAIALQDQISKLVEQELETTILTVFNKLTPANQWLKFNTVEIDLGEISREHLDRDLPDRLAKILMTALEKLLREGNFQRTKPADRAGAHPLAMLHHYLTQGLLPLQGTTQMALYTLFANVLLTDAIAFRKLLLDIGRLPDVRRRIAFQFTSEQIDQLITLIEPIHAMDISGYLHDMVQLHRIKPVVSVKASELRPVVTELALTYLLVDRGNRFNTVQFIDSQIKALSGRYNVPYEQLLSTLARAVAEPTQVTGGSSFTDIILTLYQTHTNESSFSSTRLEERKSAMNPAQDTGFITLYSSRRLSESERVRELVFYWLLHKKWPDGYPNPPVDERVGELLAQIVHRFKGQVLTFIKTHQQRPYFLETLVGVISTRLVLRLLPALQIRFRPTVPTSQLPIVLSQLTRSPAVRKYVIHAYLLFYIADYPAGELSLLNELEAVAGAYQLSWSSLNRQLLRLAIQNPALHRDPLLALLVQTATGKALFIANTPVFPLSTSLSVNSSPIVERLLVWLQTGSPSAGTLDALSSAVAELFTRPNQQEIRMLMPYLGNATTRDRLLVLLTEEQFFSLLKNVYPSHYQRTNELLRDWMQLAQSGLVGLGLQPADWFRMVLAVIQKTPVHLFTPTMLLQALLRTESQLHSGNRRKPTQLARHLLRLLPAHSLTIRSRLAALLTVLVAFPTQQPAQTRPPKTPAPQYPSTPEPEPSETVYIDNAGLVLLWPFLTMLFTRLGYLTEQQFTRPEQAERAVHLLQFLATGEEQTPEYALVLNKLLCGIEQNRPLRRELTLTAEELSMGEGLLAAVIDQWSILKNTTVEGLRQTFLMRRGKLEWLPDSVTLTVENRSFDMLLDQRPWPISTIRLPWMDRPLFAVWR